jgi:hypothetical protein
MPHTPDEEWRDIPGWEGRVQVSNLGRIRTWQRKSFWLIRKLQLGQRYLDCTMPLLADEKRQRTVTVHRLVAAAFIGPCPPGQEVRHGDAGPLVNTIANLSYGTHAENVADSVKIGSQRGERHPRARFTERDVIAIKRLLADGVRQCDIARQFGVSLVAINHIRHERRWTHVTIPAAAS